MRSTTTAVLILIISISLSLSLFSPAKAENSTPYSVGTKGNILSGYATVLIYHKFNEPGSPSTSIPSTVFESQLRYLRENNYNVVSLSFLVSLLNEGKRIPPRTVVLTIDDGYRSVYTHAYPILKKYRVPFTLFLYMEAAGRYGDFLTTEEINEMKGDGLVTFGNHSYSHKRFARRPRGMSEKDYLRWIEDDLYRSEHRFRELIGRRPLFFAYPYGGYNRRYREIVQRHGYLAALTQDTGSVNTWTDRFLIPRDPIVGTWATIRKFQDFLNTEPLHVTGFSPGYGVLKKNPPMGVEAVISNIVNYKNIGVYISEKGWLKPRVDLSSGRISIRDIGRLSRRINRIGITAINRLTGRKATFFYLIITPR